jgi:hypothetical protein
VLSKGAEDIKSGAGQYINLRALIQAMVDWVQPTTGDIDFSAPDADSLAPAQATRAARHQRGLLRVRHRLEYESDSKTVRNSAGSNA